MTKKKIFMLAAVAGLFCVFFLLDLDRFISLEYFQSQRQALEQWIDDHLLLGSLVYFLLYLLATALSLPAAAILTLVGGALFGLGWGLVLASFASSLGATLAFLVTRTVLRDWVQSRFGDYLAPLNRGMEKDGVFYLLTLRLVPIFPFFLVNILMALTPIRVLPFYLVSQIGMLFATALFVNVGAQLGQASSLPEVLSTEVFLSFVLLAVFPWLAKAAVASLQRRKVYRAYQKPSQFDANLVVIGGGSAGLVTSYIAALVKAKVILIEKHKMGGDCLNTGCVPSKAFIRSAGVKHLLERASDFGLNGLEAEVDFAALMARVRRVIEKIEPHDSVERYTALGVECIQGEAAITSPYTVSVNGREIRTRNIVLATGARPLIPPIPGLEEMGYLSSDNIWSLSELPRRLLVLGAGPIGVELAQAFARLGSQVSLVDQASRILPREDEEVSDHVAEQFAGEGIAVMTCHKALRFGRDAQGKYLLVESEGKERRVDFDEVLVAVGRKANVEGFGLEDLGLALNKNGTLEVNKYLQTKFPNIYACGDVAGPYQFTHMAAFQAWYASVNSLFGAFKKYRVNYAVVPWATFVDPEVARVGLNEREAQERGVAYEISRYGIDDLDRAIADGEARGFIKVLTVPGKDRILGATIVGYHASELINEFVLAMTHGLGLKKILATIHIYPTLGESNKYLAGEWRKRHAPQWLYPYLEKFHAWMRS